MVEVSAIFTFKASPAIALFVSAVIDAIVFDLIAYGNNIEAVSARFVFNASAVSALAFSALIDATVLDLMAYGNSIAAVSAILTFKFSAAVALAISAARSEPLFEIAFEISFETDEPNALILLDNETVSLANLRLNINAVSAKFTFKFILLESATVSLANLRLNINDVSAIFTFKASAAIALAISASKSAPLLVISFATELPKALILLDNETVSLANLRLNINAVSAIFTFKLILLERATVSLANLRLNIKAVSEIFVFKLIEAIVFDLIA